MKYLFGVSLAILLLLIASVMVQVKETTVTWGVKTPGIYEQVWKGEKAQVFKEKEVTTQRSLLEVAIERWKW
jgi:hypothetical protein